MPGTFDMTLHPFLNGKQVLLVVRQIAADVRLVGIDVVRGRNLRRRLELTAPAAVGNVRRQVVGTGVGVGGVEVHVLSRSRAVVREERVHALHLSGVRVHATGRLTRLDIAPDHGGHVAAVVHETRIEIGRVVWVGRHNVSRAARERVLEEVEHGKELARRHEHVVAVPCDHVSRSERKRGNFGSAILQPLMTE